MEFGVCTFVETRRDPPTDVFGVGERHRASYAV